MEEYLQKLSAYVIEHPPDMHSDDVHSILDALFWIYYEAAGADNKNLQPEYDALKQQLQRLPAQDVNAIINIVNDHCREHDRQGFINGFKMECVWSRNSPNNPNSTLLCHSRHRCVLFYIFTYPPYLPTRGLSQNVGETIM